MDIYPYLNSRDVREHLQKLGYAFSPLESAWIIWECQSIGIKEKHAAWRELIQTMPDQKIPERNVTRGWPSLHEFLRKQMDYENRLLEAFYQNDQDAVYTVKVVLGDARSDETMDDIFSCFATCKEYVHKYYLEEEEKAEKVHEIIISKIFLDEEDKYMRLTCNSKWEELVVSQNGKVVEDECAEEDDFAGLWFNIPTPFVKGDIVVGVHRNGWGYGSGPFVLKEILANDADFVARMQDFVGDNSDMTATGYFQADDGGIYYECMHNYLDLEYYRGDMTGTRRILKALSHFQKGEIDIALYSKAYHTIMQEEYAKSIIPRHEFTDEGLELAGLKGK